MSPGTQMTLRIYTHLLRLYPRQFRETFIDEMQVVFAMALQDATKRGGFHVARILYRELVDLPVAVISQHIYERRKIVMRMVTYGIRQDIRFIRWGTRVFSLMITGFYLSINLINEQIDYEPTIPIIIQVLLSISMLIAWRWERLGGMLTMAGTPILLTSLLVDNFQRGSWIVPTILASSAVALPYLIIGWLFYSLRQHTDIARVRQADDLEKEDTPKRYKLYLMMGAVCLLIIILLILSVTMLVGSEIVVTPNVIQP